MSSSTRVQKMTHAAVGCGNVIYGLDAVIYIGDLTEVDCPDCVRILEAKAWAERVERNRARFVVKHLNAYDRMWRSGKRYEAAYPEVLMELLAEEAPDNARLVSLVPAGSHIASGTYLATWEVQS